jgi:hypothetical protein
LRCALAAEHGLPPERALAGTGIDEAAGVRYRLTTYGIWGFAVLSSRTIRESHQVGMRFLDLSYALTRVSAPEGDGELVLRFDDVELPESVRRFVLLRDASAAVQIWREAGRESAPVAGPGAAAPPGLADPWPAEPSERRTGGRAPP